MRTALVLIAMILAAGLGATGCMGVRINVQDSSTHDENAARAEADAFLRLLYLDENVDAAYARMSEQTRRRGGVDALKNLLDLVKEKFGRVESLRAVSFAPTLGSDALSVAYAAVNARGKSYHRVVLRRVGGRYAVIEVWFSENPYGKGILTESFANAPLLTRTR